MSSISWPVQADYTLKGNKQINSETLESAIKKIHASIGWEEYDESVIKKLNERSHIKVFAFSKKDNSIIGYAVAVEKKTHSTDSIYKYSGYSHFYQYYENENAPNKVFNIYFLAVSRENQTAGIGHNILMRLIEKVRKKQGTEICFLLQKHRKIK